MAKTFVTPAVVAFQEKKAELEAKLVELRGATPIDRIAVEKTKAELSLLKAAHREAMAAARVKKGFTIDTLEVRYVAAKKKAEEFEALAAKYAAMIEAAQGVTSTEVPWVLDQCGCEGTDAE